MGGGDRVPFPEASGFSALIPMSDFSPWVVHTFAPPFSLFLSLIFFLKALNMNMSIREVGRAVVSLNQNQGYLYTCFILCVCVEGER